MKKSLYFLLFLTLSVMLVNQSCKKTEIDEFDQGGILKNASVEYGTDSPDTWIAGPGDYTDSWDKAKFYDGSRSLKLTSKSNTSENIGFWWQSITENIPFKKRLRLDVYVKTENIQGSGGVLVIRGDSNNGAMLLFETTQLTRQITGTSEWTKYSLETKDVVPESVYMLHVFLVLGSKTEGAIYFDKISLTAL